MATKLQNRRSYLQSFQDDILDAFYTWKLDNKIYWPWESQANFYDPGNFICWLWGHQFEHGQELQTITKAGRVTSRYYCKRCQVTVNEYKAERMWEKGIFLGWWLKEVIRLLVGHFLIL